MTYPVVEKFKAIQGEGMYTGTPMAFIRLQGCSVGKTICHNCDTDFKDIYAWKGGGLYGIEELAEWIGDYRHVCLTGGEPFDHDLSPFIHYLPLHKNVKIHIETSGTAFYPDFLEAHMRIRDSVHICVSPKPGWKTRWIEMADEIKVIVGGLGSGEGWPTLTQTLNWADWDKVVYLQPVNRKNEPDKLTLSHALELVDAYPQLRLSVQLHKYIGVR
jgi:7-carboxy-7-deazaguanine synthase